MNDGGPCAEEPYELAVGAGDRPSDHNLGLAKVSVSHWGHPGRQNGAPGSVRGSKKRPPSAHNGFEPTCEVGYNEIANGVGCGIV